MLKQQILTCCRTKRTSASICRSISDLAEEHDATAIAAAILKLYAEETGRAARLNSRKTTRRSYRSRRRAGRRIRGEAGMARLCLNVGRNLGSAAGYRRRDRQRGGHPRSGIGAIDIFDATRSSMSRTSSPSG